VKVHLAAYRDDRVGVGALVYADFKVHPADLRSLLKLSSSDRRPLSEARAYHTDSLARWDDHETGVLLFFW
jgi:hypothetical protein